VKPSAALLAAAAVSAGCADEAEPRAQWQVTVSTDAPIPQLGDRLLADVLDASGDPACADRVGCRRIFGAGRESFWPASFGIAATDAGTELRLHIRLYRLGITGQDGLPVGPALIEHVARLPRASGLTPVHVELAMRCFGVASAPSERSTCDPATGELGPEPLLGAAPASLPQPHDWPPGRVVPCPAAVASEMACIAGGAFLLGSFDSVVQLEGLEATPERLVTLSPFALDMDEVTVGEVRALVAAGALSSTPIPRDPAVGTVNHACTHYEGPDDPEANEAPVNCLSPELAREICKARNKRLPTEAEWEFAASNRMFETVHPWGDDTDICARSVVAIGRTDVQVVANEDPSCRGEHPDLSLTGPLPGGDDDDVTIDGIRNLGGNLAEWVEDDLAPYDSPCWQPEESLLTNPVCKGGASLTGFDARGSDWAGPRWRTRSYVRSSREPSPYVGVRCAKSF